MLTNFDRKPGLFMANSVPMTFFRLKAVDVYVHEHDHDDEHVVVNENVVLTWSSTWT